MNFLLCNRCNKKSEDNILNYNSTEILLKNNQNIFNSSIIKKIESIDQFPNLNIGDNMVTSINNLNNVEEEKDDDELEIIEYPYSKKEKKITTSKIIPKQFKNNRSKFNNKLIEQDIIKQLNHFGEISISNSKTENSNKKRNNKNQIGKKVRINDNELERKDTMTDPANIALSSLIQDINKKNIYKEKNNFQKVNKKNDDEDDIITINNELENDFFDLKISKNNKEITLPEKRKNNNNFIKKNIEKNKIKIQDRKNRKSYNNKTNIKYENLINKITKRKISQNKKISEYNNNILKKKNILKNKGVLSSNNNMLGISSINLSNKKNFPKSYSFNCFSSEKKINDTNSSKKVNNTNELGYSLTLSKKYNKLYNHIFKVNEGFLSSKKNDKNNNKNKNKITHKKVSRAQVPIQKALSSHIASYK